VSVAELTAATRTIAGLIAAWTLAE
jgi:hypothetical protein